MERKELLELADRLNTHAQSAEGDLKVYALCIWNKSLNDASTVIDRINEHVRFHNLSAQMFGSEPNKEDSVKEIQDGLELVMFQLATAFLGDEENVTRRYPELGIFVERIANKILNGGD